jgi:hypothetical protein
VLHQSFVRFIFIHSVFAYHEGHSFLDVKHKIVNALTIPQLNAKFRERNFLRGPINIVMHDLDRGPAMRDRPNPGSNELFDNVAASKDNASEMKSIFATSDPHGPMVELRSVHNS